jgi:hypothetical protein
VRALVDVRLLLAASVKKIYQDQNRRNSQRLTKPYNAQVRHMAMLHFKRDYRVE